MTVPDSSVTVAESPVAAVTVEQPLLRENELLPFYY